MNEMKNAIILTMVFVLCAFAVQAGGNTNIVVMLGDSTTQCSLNKPGAKLTDYVQTYLAKKHLQAKIINSGDVAAKYVAPYIAGLLAKPCNNKKKYQQESRQQTDGAVKQDTK